AAAAAAAAAANAAAADANAAAEAAAAASRAEAASAAADARASFPTTPPTCPRDPARPWTAVDELDVSSLFTLPLAAAIDPPSELFEHWARVQVDILERWEKARTERDRDRALKWFLCAHFLFWRSVRGGPRGRTQLRARFAAWECGDYAHVYDCFMTDVENARRRGPRPRPTTDIHRALELVYVGELGKAVKLITSKGIGDPKCAEVVAQMAAKHPPRNRAMDLDLGNYPEPLPITLDLTETYRKLRPKSGVGPDGLRNEHLTPLSYTHRCPKAKRVMSFINTFESNYAEGRMPLWYYGFNAAATLIPLIKKEAATPGATPDCRPIGMPSVRPRATGRCFAASIKEQVASFCHPVQVGVGVPGGAQQLPVGLRTMMEVHPEYLFVKVDEENAFNRLERKVAVERCLEVGGAIGALGRLAHAELSPRSPIYLGGALAAFSSSNGGRQGQAIFPSVYAVATHHEVAKVNAKLSPSGGARAFFDDLYLFGPPLEVLEALDEFGIDIASSRNGKLRRDKCVAYSPAHGAAILHRPELQHLVRTVYDSSGRRTQTLNGIPVSAEGFDCCGVPLGCTAYVQRAVNAQVDAMCNTIQTVQNALAPSYLHALHAIERYCLAPLGDFLASTVYPSQARAALGRFDAALDACVKASFGCGGDFVESDPYAQRRLRLPARRKGLGIRSRVDVADAAFVGCVCAVLPEMLDRGSLKGFLPALEPVFGAGAFDDVNALRRFDGLLSNYGHLPLAAELRGAWSRLQQDYTATAGSAPTSGPLAAPAAAAGIDLSERCPYRKMQKAITEQREAARAARLATDLRRLPARDPRKTSYFVADRMSRAWVQSWPTRSLQISNSDLAEIATNYLGLASPACRNHVGKSILGTASVLDPHGHILLSHNRLVNKDSSRTRWHDATSYELSAYLHEAGISHEVECSGLFASVAPAAYWNQSPWTASRIIPDFAIRGPAGTPTPEEQRLFDVKTISDCETRYKAPNCEGRNDKANPVNQRAAHVDVEYVAHARELDRKWHNVQPPATGPFGRRLAEFGQVGGLVFGHYGECSDTTHKLIGTIAEQIALKTGLQEGALSIPHATAAQTRRLYRTLSILSHRERARLVLTNLKYVGDGSATAGIQRAAHYRRQHAAARRAAYQEHTSGGPSTSHAPWWGASFRPGFG
ncbi:MAG: hypothetical protein AAF809_14355, partial [Bacteroidota bacterium]